MGSLLTCSLQFETILLQRTCKYTQSNEITEVSWLISVLLHYKYFRKLDTRNKRLRGPSQLICKFKIKLIKFGHSKRIFLCDSTEVFTSM